MHLTVKKKESCASFTLATARWLPMIFFSLSTLAMENELSKQFWLTKIFLAKKTDSYFNAATDKSKMLKDATLRKKLSIHGNQKRYAKKLIRFLF